MKSNTTTSCFHLSPSSAFIVFTAVLILSLVFILLNTNLSDKLSYSVQIVGRETLEKILPDLLQNFWINQKQLPYNIADTKWTEYSRLNKTEKLNLLINEKASMTDPRLIDLIREHIQPPLDKPYSLKNSAITDYSCGQSTHINNLIMKSKKNGFFVEAGAWLGEYASTSLFFEKSLGWNGLLVEPDPVNFKQLRQLNRKALHINACLSTHPFPIKLKLNSASDMSRTIERKEDEQWVIDHHFDIRPYYEVPCFPLYSIMLAINQTSIDYFGLDVEGNELPILETIPFDDLNITSLTTECLEMNTKGGKNAAAVRTFLENKGFTCHGIIGANSGHGCFAEDLVFFKKGLVSEQFKCSLVLDPFKPL